MEDKRMETPYFMVDKEILNSYCEMLEHSLQENWNNYTIGYSFKTNSLPWLVSYVKKRGMYAEVVSHDEYLLAKRMGYDDSKIIYNGPYKEESSFETVLLGGGIVNIDSKRELHFLKNIVRKYSAKKVKVGIRINFNLEALCPGETTMGEESGRFGFCYENGGFKEVLDFLRQFYNVQVVGIHLHSSSRTRSLNVFKRISQFACKVKEEFDLNLEYVDIGGGFCGGMEGRPEYVDYFPVIANELKKTFSTETTKLIVEPGISLISKCSQFVTQVYDVRDIRDTRYIMTDGSRFNIDATMIKNSYLYHVCYEPNNTSRSVMEKQVITGFTCMECDRLFEMVNEKELYPGDKIVYENVGGYTMSLNPLFIQYFPAVYVKEHDELTLVRRKWTPDDYISGSMLES